MLTSNAPVHASSHPDLEVGTPSVNDATLYTGNSFTLSVTVTNAGDGASEATTLRYYRSTDSTISTSDTAQGTESVGALAADGTSDHDGGMTAPSDAGTYYYGACVDSVTGESDTSDNCSTAVTVTVNARPDLVVDKPGQDMKVRPGATFTLSPKVRNIGDAESSATTLRYYSRYTVREEYGQAPMGQDTEVGTDAIGALAPGGESGTVHRVDRAYDTRRIQGSLFLRRLRGQGGRRARHDEQLLESHRSESPVPAGTDGVGQRQGYGGKPPAEVRILGDYHQRGRRGCQRVQLQHSVPLLPVDRRHYHGVGHEAGRGLVWGGCSLRDR